MIVVTALLSNEEMVQYIEVMRDGYDEPSEELQRAVLDAAIARFGVCDCGECKWEIGGWFWLVSAPAKRWVWLGPNAKFCPACGRRLSMEVPHD